MNIIDLRLLSVWFIPGLLAITLHEAAHAFAASKLGDNTAKLLGRLSLNPFVHVDTIGTIVVPITLLLLRSSFLFGWARPVPIQSRYFKRPKLDNAIVAISGPLANLFMAIFWALLAKICLLGYLNALGSSTLILWLRQSCEIGINFNILLLVFNMIPIPPLDGSKCLALILPNYLDTYYQLLEDYTMHILAGTALLSFILTASPWTLISYFLSYVLFTPMFKIRMLIHYVLLV